LSTSTESCYTRYQSPVGELIIVGSGSAVTRIGFPTHRRKSSIQQHLEQNRTPFAEVCRQLELYFDRKLRTFDVPLQPAGTGFQQQVWQHLQEIPYGDTVSYSDIANAIGNPKATRAVGSANGSNPIPIIIPCHRVIGRDGSLTGFGGGLPMKRFLLQLEDTEQLSLAF
jgi:methylated-DNA-[protein]-cysteine S-methyltransferase